MAKSITEVSQFWAELTISSGYRSEAIFQFLPVGIPLGLFLVKMRPVSTGIVMGCLVSPQLLNAYSVASAPAAEIAKSGCGTLDSCSYRIGYQAQVIPAFLAGFVPLTLKSSGANTFQKWFQWSLYLSCHLTLATRFLVQLVGQVVRSVNRCSCWFNRTC